jgi:hypothetical protein
MGSRRYRGKARADDIAVTLLRWLASALCVPSPRHGRACPGHPRLAAFLSKAWMPGIKPGMTEERGEF